ncbi:four helix bundle protein [Candidatus Berkelbacteria bacterium RIFOXYA2_FULL_43_10]|uniref:Four helix bundle protein n=1 Tax=Candidatus Berkelbacteria bacterium RIFOXYA2_FULL_43_10 TaxID=1797472 RepID=A0A1F5E416_9BACT|nr:MAG: four helix bundle protein [Candidatus Berkelbacteria bacterium RIFOXYA2_FULL_43_10]
MGKIVTFRDLIVWQKSHQLTLEVYRTVKDFPRYEEFGLSSQMRRSASSVPATIAEGFKRKSNKDSCHFYNIAASSLEELKYHLILSKDLQYISEEQFDLLFNKAEEISRLLHSWKESQK